MTKRWKILCLALLAPLTWISPALADVAYMREPYPYGNPLLAEPGTEAVNGALTGGVMVLIALLPAIGAWLLANVRSGRMPKWRGVLDFALFLVLLAGIALLFGWHLTRTALSVPGAVLVSAGTATISGVAWFEALRSKRKAWLVAAAVLAAGAIVFLSCALYRAALPDPDAPYTRKEWNDLQDKWEREHNEARQRMLEERRREWEWRHGNDILYGR